MAGGASLQWAAMPLNAPHPRRDVKQSLTSVTVAVAAPLTDP